MTTFQRISGSFHIVLESFEDLERVAAVPEAHWVATACPIDGLTCDPVFLQRLDRDKNGRVRVDDVRWAIRFLGERLARRDALASDVLTLGSIAPGASDVRSAAELVVDAVGAADRSRVTLTQVREVHAGLKERSRNGDGIVPATAVEDAALRALVEQILTVMPPKTDASGQPGLDRATVEAFGDARIAALAWRAARAETLVWGPDSVAMARDTLALAPRLAEYFLQCRVVASQPEAAEAFRLSGGRLAEMLGNPEAVRKGLADLPLAPPDARGVLDFSRLYRGSSFEACVAWSARVVGPVLGTHTLDEAGLQKLTADATAIVAWADAEAGHKVLDLGPALEGATPEAQAALATLCDEDHTVAAPLAGVADLELLVLAQRWLLELANNFVAMPLLYNRRQPTLFEQGRLVLDGREFGFATKVVDRGTHTTLAKDSYMYLMYVKVYGGEPAIDMEVCVPVTGGTSRGLVVGKRGIFIDIRGAEHDATVVAVVTNPVSILEAVLQPFQRIAGMIGSRLDKWQASADAEFEAKLTANADAVQATAAQAGSGAPPPEAPASPAPAQEMSPSAIAGVAAAGGLALAAIGSAAAWLVSAATELGPLGSIGAVVGLLGIIAMPFAIVAWWKLRQRNLAGVLEAGGWALNARLKLSRRLGRLYTRRPARPAGSRVNWADPAMLDTPDADDREPGAVLQRVALALVLLLGVAALVVQFSPLKEPVYEWLGVSAAPAPTPAVEAEADAG